MQRINSSLLSGLYTGQRILNVLDLPQLSTIFQKIRFLILFNTFLMAYCGHAGLTDNDLILFICCVAQQLDPLKHPALSDSQKLYLLHEKFLLILRHYLHQTLLFRIQAIKKESLKLSRSNCILIFFWSTRSKSIFVSRLTAFSFRNVAFPLLQRCIIPVISILPASDRSFRNFQKLRNFNHFLTFQEQISGLFHSGIRRSGHAPPPLIRLFLDIEK